MSEERRGGSPDELKRLIAESHAGGHIDLGEAGMLTGVFHLHEQEARQVMTPIPAVVTVDAVAGRRGRAAVCASPAVTRAWSSPRPTIATACAASCTPTRSSQQLMEDGPHAADRAARARRADRA